jgi:hypothetical protein
MSKTHRSISHDSIVNDSLPLVALFYGKEAAARAERKEAEQIQKQKSRRLLQEALTVRR